MILSYILNDAPKSLAKFLMCLCFSIGTVACFATEPSADENRSTDNQITTNPEYSQSDITNNILLKEVRTLSVQSYWFGLSRVHSVDDKVSSLRIQRILTPSRDIESDKSIPSVLIVVGSNSVPLGITGFELYLPENMNYGWKVKKRTDEGSGTYKISFYEDAENHTNPEIVFNVSIRRCNEKFCAEVTN